MSRGLAVLTFFWMLCTTVEVGAAQDPADAAWKRGDIETAQRLYGERLASDSTDERALHRMALVHKWNGQYGESIRLFDRLLAISPRNWEAAVDRARVFASQGDVQQAIRLVDQVLEVQAAYVPALQARAQFQSWAGEYRAALSTYEQIGQIVPEDRSVARTRARVLSWASRLDAARAIYDSLLRADPNDREALLALGRVLAWAGQLDSSAAIYRTMLAADSDDADALQGLGRALSWRGDLVGGERPWRRAVQVEPNSVDALVGLAANLRWQGRDAAALEVLRRAERVAPAHGDIRSEMRWLDAALAPRVASSFVYENDSDGNRISTFTNRAAWRPLPHVELRAMGYTRDLDLSGAIPVDHQAYGGHLEAWAQLEPGWAIALGVGLSGSNLADRGTTGRFSGKITSPGRHRIIGAVGYTHEPLDASAQLLQNNVAIDQWSVELRVTPVGGWTVAVAASYTDFDGTTPNTRRGGFVGVTRRLSRQFTVGTSVRAFGFEENLNDGYFDPDLYVLGEINARWQHQLGRWYPAVEVAPGLQQVGKGGDVSGSVRARLGLGYRIAPGRQLDISGGYSTSGLSVFGSNGGRYRYRTVTASANWVF